MFQFGSVVSDRFFAGLFSVLWKWFLFAPSLRGALRSSARRHQPCPQLQLCKSSRASLPLLLLVLILLLLGVSEDNSLKSGAAIESELASCQPQLLLLQSKEAERPRRVCADIQPTCAHESPSGSKNKKERPAGSTVTGQSEAEVTEAGINKRAMWSRSKATEERHVKRTPGSQARGLQCQCFGGVWFETEVGWKRCGHSALGVAPAAVYFWNHHHHSPLFVLLSERGLLSKERWRLAEMFEPRCSPLQH